MKFKLKILMILFMLLPLFSAWGKEVPFIKTKVIMSGLENPWDIAFTKNGKAMFYTEKTKGLSVKVGRKIHALYGIKGSSGYADKGDDLFSFGGQEGMLGVELDANFDKNRILYLFSTSNKYHGDGCKNNCYSSFTRRSR